MGRIQLQHIVRPRVARARKRNVKPPEAYRSRGFYAHSWHRGVRGPFESSGLVHHFLCHYTPVGHSHEDGASLFMPLQAGWALLGRWCTTFYATARRLGTLAKMVHHFLCHCTPVGHSRDDGASLLVSLHAGWTLSRRWCITFYATARRLGTLGTLVHHFLCHCTRESRQN